jgi:hypothetical protein
MFRKQTPLNHILKTSMGFLHYKVKSSYRGQVHIYLNDEKFYFNEISFFDEIMANCDTNLYLCFDKRTLSIKSDTFNLFFKSDDPNEIELISKKVVKKIFSQSCI